MPSTLFSYIYVFIHVSLTHRHLHSFPTRRSSDLMLNSDVISMPDKWEYPWYAAWDLAFHTISLSLVDFDFAKEQRSEEHTSELQSHSDLVCRLLLEKKRRIIDNERTELTRQMSQC